MVRIDSVIRRDAPSAKAAGEFIVLLDERGETWTSTTFAGHLTKWQDNPAIKTLTFIIGDPYGHNDATRAIADRVWSVSAGTLPSDLAWVVAWEQVYRAVTIQRGMPYHHA